MSNSEEKLIESIERLNKNIEKMNKESGRSFEATLVLTLLVIFIALLQLFLSVFTIPYSGITKVGFTLIIMVGIVVMVKILMKKDK